MTFDQWLKTWHGKKCANYPVSGAEYLRNRLWWAFEAGRAAERGDTSDASWGAPNGSARQSGGNDNAKA